MGECLIIKTGGLDTSDANATSDKVLQGYTCYVNDVLITGTMIDYSLTKNQDTAMGAPGVDHRPLILAVAADQIWLLNNKDKVLRLCLAIPKNGYYSNHTFVGIDYAKFAHKLILDNLTTGANATPASIYQGIVGYVNGQRIVGTMADRGSTSYTLPINTTYWIPQGVHNGGGYVNQSIPVQNGWTVTPGVNNIVACWAGHYTTGDIWCAGDANLVPWNIRNGFNIFGVTGTFSGWVDGWVSWDAPGIGGNRVKWDIGIEYTQHWQGGDAAISIQFKSNQATNLINQGFKSMRIDCNVTLHQSHMNGSFKYFIHGHTGTLGNSNYCVAYEFNRAPTAAEWQAIPGTYTQPLKPNQLNYYWICCSSQRDLNDASERFNTMIVNSCSIWVCK